MYFFFILCFSFPDIKQLLIYPPGKGGLPINTEDYLCLAQDQFLNDVIIDFYLKYLLLNLPVQQQEKVHVFSTFFYKRLTTKPFKATRYKYIICIKHFVSLRSDKPFIYLFIRYLGH